jgi:hypothetical protein
VSEGVARSAIPATYFPPRRRRIYGGYRLGSDERATGTNNPKPKWQPHPRQIGPSIARSNVKVTLNRPAGGVPAGPWRVRAKRRNDSARLPASLLSVGTAQIGVAATSGSPRRWSSARTCPSSESPPRDLRNRAGTNGVRLTQVVPDPSSGTDSPPIVRNAPLFPIPRDRACNRLSLA